MPFFISTLVLIFVYLHAKALQDRVIKEAQTIPYSVGQDDPTVEGEGL